MEIGKMTIAYLLEYLDGAGLVLTDDELIQKELNKIGIAVFDTIKIYKGNGEKQ